MSEEKKPSRIDVVHKMGRQIQGYLAMIIAAVLIFNGHDISIQEAGLIAGPASLYILMKGKGQ